MPVLWTTENYTTWTESSHQLSYEVKLLLFVWFIVISIFHHTILHHNHRFLEKNCIRASSAMQNFRASVRMGWYGLRFLVIFFFFFTAKGNMSRHFKIVHCGIKAYTCKFILRLTLTLLRQIQVIRSSCYPSIKYVRWNLAPNVYVEYACVWTPPLLKETYFMGGPK